MTRLNNDQLRDGIIALLSGHHRLKEVKSIKYVLCFELDSNPVLAFERKLKTKQNLWIEPALISDALVASIKADERPFGIRLNGELADTNQKGRHANVNTFLGEGTLLCFHPRDLDEAWIVLSELGK